MKFITFYCIYCEFGTENHSEYQDHILGHHIRESVHSVRHRRWWQFWKAH